MTNQEVEHEWWDIEPPDYDLEPVGDLVREEEQEDEEEHRILKNEGILRFSTVSKAFIELGARDWVEANRVATNSGEMNITDTAEHVGVDLEWIGRMRPMGCILFRTDYDPEVFINRTINTDEFAVTFGHEMGHLFIHDVLGVDTNSDTELFERGEEFCTYFGIQMALPPKVLAKYKDVSPKTIEEISKTFQLTTLQVMEQLMRANRLPRRISWVSWTSEDDDDESLKELLPEMGTSCIDCEEPLEHDHQSDEDIPFVGVVSGPDDTNTCLSLSIMRYQKRKEDVAKAISKCVESKMWSFADEKTFQASSALTIDDKLLIEAILNNREHAIGNQPALFP